VKELSRRNQPWTPPEDRRLLDLFLREARRGKLRKNWNGTRYLSPMMSASFAVGDELGRGCGAVQTRLGILGVCDCHKAKVRRIRLLCLETKIRMMRRAGKIPANSV
jgi:hypothetical protein